MSNTLYYFRSLRNCRPENAMGAQRKNTEKAKKWRHSSSSPCSQSGDQNHAVVGASNVTCNRNKNVDTWKDVFFQ